MALNKQSVTINFASGLQTKADPKQVQVGNFLSLKNTVFDKAGALVKRYGYKDINHLPNSDQTTLTTFNNNLIATGSNLYSLDATTNTWVNKGVVQPVDLNVISLVRNSSNQSTTDSSVADNGMCCVAYSDGTNSYYEITDSRNGNQIVTQQQLVATAKNPKVFILNKYFIVTYMATISATVHYQFVAIPIAKPTSPLAAQDISTTVSSINAGYDCVVMPDGNLYTTWSGSASTVKTTFITKQLIVGTSVSISSATATRVSMSVDVSNARVWSFYYDLASQDGYVVVYDLLLAQILPPTLVVSGIDLNHITITANNNEASLFYEVDNTYAYSSVKTNYIDTDSIDIDGNLTGSSTLLRSVGLASKSFYDELTNKIYMLVVYGSTNQSTYFLIDSDGVISMRLAYANGSGFITTPVLPNVSFANSTYHCPYLVKNFLAPVNKETNLPSGTPTNGIFTQVGINLAKFQINMSGQYSSEIAGSLHLTGGQLWQYDGVKPIEHGFHLYPENIAITTATGSGSIAAGDYFYTFVYEWTDNNGNIHRSAPSIPVKQTTTTASSTNTCKVPTLRLTDKVSPNPIRIVGYRWSTSQQTYYQFTSITSPTLNDITVDYVTITDTLADSSILGNTVLYTTGGVVENIAAPASSAITLFKNRLFIVNAENRNSISYSKPILQNTPVEMSDLFTIYVSPTSGAQGSTGDVTALSSMDDKLIIFKRDAIYYVTGTGPDVTGNNNDFSDPIFITSSVGCDNPKSITLTPNGLMFQSDKGIWLLGRDLGTNYIGAPVEAFNSVPVVKAQTIPGTNQVRFVLNNRITLIYDYYYQQWGSFDNISAISATLYNGYDTYISNLGYVYQETPNYYLDGSTPVLISFTTSWVSLAGIQGLERFYELYFLGTYYSPFKLNVKIAYDFNSSAEQSVVIEPDNYSPVWGGESLWGGGQSWGGPGNVLRARVFPQIQKCETFQITVTEVYDPSLGQKAGQGLNLSALSAIVGVKRGYRTNKASQSFG